MKIYERNEKMQVLMNLFDDAAELCRAANLEYVEIRKPGFDEFYFMVFWFYDEEDSRISYPMATCYRKNDKDFDFDIPLYKRGALDFLGIEADKDASWHITEESKVKIETGLEILIEKTKEC